MKKVSILLLLTVVLASFAFAIEGVGDFEAGLEIDFVNVGGGNDGDLSIELYPYISFSRAFGAFSLSAELGDEVGIPTADGADVVDDLYFKVTPSYSLAAGPGELGFALSAALFVPITDPAGPTGGFGGDNALFFRIDPSISYGLDAGFGALAFELGTDHLQIGKTKLDGADWKYQLENLPIYLKAGVDLSFGLGLWVKPVLTIATEDGSDTELTEFVFDIHYAITEAINAGVETSIPTVEDGIKYGGITITPYGKFSFGALGAYVMIELSQLAAEEPVSGDAKDLQITPIIGVSYSF
jgi:hypothetical protein